MVIPGPNVVASVSLAENIDLAKVSSNETVNSDSVEDKDAPANVVTTEPPVTVKVAGSGAVPRALLERVKALGEARLAVELA